MTPGKKYQRDLSRADFVADAAQQRAVEQLDRIYLEVLQSYRAGRAGKLRAWLALLGRGSRWEPVRGVYFWGGVGRGKTYLMDLFYDALPFEEKQRTHFHRFMRHVHRELNVLAGEKDPLPLIARRLAKRTRVLCFDEFFVSDIADAMILAKLLQGLFEQGVTLLATSNIVPDDLYRDGLQRARFLPAIELIKQHVDVVNVDSGNDYRLRVLERAELYHSPLDELAEESLLQSFIALAPDTGQRDVQLEVEGRYIAARWVADDVVWFEFAAICDGPRSQNDYIELSREFHAVLIGNVPVFDQQDDKARRFINLVDEFYDRNVKLVLSAAAALPDLYRGGRLAFEFQRTSSRLLEMQSHEYLAREHRP
jgi:cell division protein ZapE